MTMSLPRRVEPELLDGLAADDPRAKRSRDDLRRIQLAMATLRIALRALERGSDAMQPHTLLELGAGDGSLLLRLAHRKSGAWPALEVTLLDRLNLVSDATLGELRALGWTPRVVAADVFDWLAKTRESQWDIVFANLFMHHFSSMELQRLLAWIAARSRVFFCCEPRRAALPLAASHLVGLIGAGPVTRRDAVLSVHAGFRAQELSGLWPNPRDFKLREYPAGLFSHCFLAVRT